MLMSESAVNDTLECLQLQSGLGINVKGIVFSISHVATAVRRNA